MLFNKPHSPLTFDSNAALKMTSELSHPELNIGTLLGLSCSNTCYGLCVQETTRGQHKIRLTYIYSVLWQQKRHDLNITLALHTHANCLCWFASPCVCSGRVSLRRRRAKSSSTKSRSWQGCQKSPRDYSNSTQTSLELITSRWSKTPIR